MGLLLMTGFTLQEALRRRLFLAVLLISILLLVAFALLLHAALGAMFASGGGAAPQWDLFGAGITISIPAAWLVFLLSCMLTIFLSANMISGEIEAGTLAIIVPKPVRRYEIVFGKWLGYALIISVYTTFLFSAFLAVIYLQTGYWPSQYGYALATLILAVLALLGVTTLGSALYSTVVNGAIALTLFIGAPIASFVASISNFVALTQHTTSTRSDALQQITTVINLIIPTDALWHGTSYFLLPPIAMQLMGSAAPISSLPIISAQPVASALFIWVALYILVLPSLALWRFQHRDL